MTFKRQEPSGTVARQGLATYATIALHSRLRVFQQGRTRVRGSGGPRPLLPEGTHMGDEYSNNAAAKNAQKMVRILDTAKPSQTDPFGLAEDQVVTLFQLWLIVGSWGKTADYVNLYKDGMLYPRAPKPTVGGHKDLDLVRPAIKGVA